MTGNYLIFLMVTVAGSLGGKKGIEAFQQSIRDRWESLYSLVLPDYVKFVAQPDGAILCELVDFPIKGSTRATHFQGSPIEAETDKKKVKGYVEKFASKYKDKALVAYKVLEGWASSEFKKTLETLGYYDVELSTIMTVESVDQLIPPRPLAEGFKIEKITKFDDMIRFGQLHGFTCQWVIEKLPESILTDRRLSFWQVIHVESGDVATTALVETVNGIAGLHMVETFDKYRRKGLAAALVFHAVVSAFQENKSLQSFVLGSTPEAVTLYSRIGFISYGFYRSFDYLGNRETGTITSFNRKRSADLF